MTKARVWQVYDADGAWMGTIRVPELAAKIAADMGVGARVDYHGVVVWREGREEFRAGDGNIASAAMVIAIRSV